MVQSHVSVWAELRLVRKKNEMGWEFLGPRVATRRIAGYKATVDGVPAGIAHSPDGLVMVMVPAGSTIVELRYTGSLLLRATFWTSFAGWLLLPGAFLRWLWARKVEGRDGPVNGCSTE
jgi:hypothetical protein